MSNRDFNTDLFDRYLRHQLNESELVEFDNNLLNDDEFNADFIAYKTIALGIRDYGKTALKEHLKNHAKIPVKSNNLRFTRMAYAMAAVVLLFIGVAVVINYYSGSNAKPELAIIPAVKEQQLSNDTAAIVSEAEMANVSKQSAAPTLAKKERMPVEQKNDFVERLDEKDAAMAGDTRAGVADNEGAPATEPYKIVSDSKTGDTILFAYTPVDMDNISVKNVSADKEMKAKKSIPSANNNNYSKNYNKSYDTMSKFKGKSEDIKTESYNIEFWQSPVNFKGYKMTDKTIQLYGMPNKNVALYSYKNKLYLRNGTNVLYLTPCIDGCTYKNETDAEIINLILNQ